MDVERSVETGETLRQARCRTEQGGTLPGLWSDLAIFKSGAKGGDQPISSKQLGSAELSSACSNQLNPSVHTMAYRNKEQGLHLTTRETKLIVCFPRRKKTERRATTNPENNGR